jgi:hypothetical protein
MNSEQVKAEKFFDRLTGNGTMRILARIGMVCLVVVIMIACIIPAQEIYSNFENGESGVFIGTLISLFSFMLVYLKTSYFKVYMESQNSRYIPELLAYHPISKKAIWEIEIKSAGVFMAKVTLVGLVIQCISSYVANGTISILEFVHIIAWVFFVPMAMDLLLYSCMNMVTKECF